MSRCTVLVQRVSSADSWWCSGPPSFFERVFGVLGEVDFGRKRRNSAAGGCANKVFGILTSGRASDGAVGQTASGGGLCRPRSRPASLPLRGAAQPDDRQFRASVEALDFQSAAAGTVNVQVTTSAGTSAASAANQLAFSTTSGSGSGSSSGSAAPTNSYVVVPWPAGGGASGAGGGFVMAGMTPADFGVGYGSGEAGIAAAGLMTSFTLPVPPEVPRMVQKQDYGWRFLAAGRTARCGRSVARQTGCEGTDGLGRAGQLGVPSGRHRSNTRNVSGIVYKAFQNLRSFSRLSISTRWAWSGWRRSKLSCVVFQGRKFFDNLFMRKEH